MDREPLSYWSGYGCAPRRKLTAAALLILDALDRLHLSTIESNQDELERRELELVGRSLVDLVRELATVLTALRAPLEPPEACPLCGWRRPANESGKCPRCQQTREAADDPNDLQARFRQQRRKVRAL